MNNHEIIHPYSTPKDIAHFAELMLQLVQRGMTFEVRTNPAEGVARIQLTGGF